jgi:integron integrase
MSDAADPAKLLDRIRLAIRSRHYSRRTEEAYVGWARRFILFHQKRHPREMGEPEVAAFLTNLSAERRVAGSTHNQALSALLFLYREVLGRGPEPAVRPARLPVVLTRGEVGMILSRLKGPVRLVCELLYGAGLRLLEALMLRVEDIDEARGEIRLRDGKGRKDRVTVLPSVMRPRLHEQLERVRALHQADLAAGRGRVALPDGLEVKYPAAPGELAWQWVFPATRHYVDRASGERRRHHLHESVVQRAVRAAGVSKLASCHTLRHSFATHPGIGLRHPDDPGAAGAPGRVDDDDLHARAGPWPSGRAESVGRPRLTDYPELAYRTMPTSPFGNEAAFLADFRVSGRATLRPLRAAGAVPCSSLNVRLQNMIGMQVRTTVALLIVVTIVGATCGRGGQDDNALDPQISAPLPAAYEDIRDGRDWLNPKVVIRAEGVEVVSEGIPGGRQTVPVDELRNLLVDLPVQAWPYGRVVMATDIGIRRGDLSDEEPIRRNREAAQQILDSLDVRVEWWPS